MKDNKAPKDDDIMTMTDDLETVRNCCQSIIKALKTLINKFLIEEHELKD